MRPILFFFLLFGFVETIQAQQKTIEIFDAISREPLYGALVLSKNETLGISDLTGKVSFSLPINSDSILVKHIGHLDTYFSCKENLTAVFIQPTASSMNTVVIGSSKYLQPLELQTVSIDVVKSNELIQRITPDLAKAAERIAGLTIIDGQASIRGGSGYAFGAGSRVLLVVDNMPLITADRNDVKWNYVPLELADQIEIVKGASSVQYGSSALNGVIHVRTSYPGPKPETFVSTFATKYSAPSQDGQQWWNARTAPYQAGLQFRHKERLKNGVDLVIGGNTLRSSGWLSGEYENRERLSFRTRKIWKEGKKSAGIDGNFMHQKAGFFFFWNNDNTGAYLPYSTSTNVGMNDFWMNIDPWYTVYDKRANKHTIKGRYYFTLGVGGKDWSPVTHQATADYQFQHNFKNKAVITAGATANQFFFIDSGLGGTHFGSLRGTYAQFELPKGKWQFNVGLRQEWFAIDTIKTKSIPVGRAGINYQVAANTFLRLSFGQGFRFPSPAERYVKTDLDIIHIYPNPNLRPEMGWGGELGVKQRLIKGNFQAYADLAIFLTRYRDLLEFTFGKWGHNTDPFLGLGFKSVNITAAQIGGWELSLNTDSKWGKWKVLGNVGYTYICPIDLNKAPELRQMKRYIPYTFEHIARDEKADSSPILKYRYRHLIKSYLDFQSPSGITCGAGLRVYSYMEQVDSIFELVVPDLVQYRLENQRPSTFADLRVGYFNGVDRFTFQVTNVFNSMNTIRPAKPEAPRGFMLQYARYFLPSESKHKLR